MDSQKKQMTKTNRVTVPFYSPPTRHYGQTPSEIIREARASVMGMSSPNIKPVVTDRPFTPKEKERTLFGNVKKRLSRPPSSFSLSYLQKQDPLPRIKLPAIGSNPEKKISHTPAFRSVHSLDNLLEDYESEIFEESRQSDSKDLPYFRKSYSSPQERRTSRKISSEKMTPKVPDKRSIYTISQKCDPNLLSCNIVDKKLINLEEPGQIGLDFSEPRSTKKPLPFELNSGEMDLLEVSRFIDKKEVEDEKKACNENISAEKSQEIDEKKNYPQIVSVEDESVRNFVVTQSAEGMIEETTPEEATELKREGEEVNEECNVKKETDILIVSDTNEFDGSETHKSGSASNASTARGSSTEKCVATEFTSEYLSMISNKSSDKPLSETQKSKEILELYETANYYGVLLDDQSKRVTEKPEKPRDSISKLCRKGELHDKSRRKSSHLDTMKENIRIFDEKMRQLNHSIENFEEKLKGTSASFPSNKTAEIGSSATDEPGKHNVKDNKHQDFINNIRLKMRPEGKVETMGWDGFWKSSYYRQKAEEETSQATEHKNSKTLEQCIEKLTKMKTNAAGDRDVVQVVEELYKALQRGGLIHNNILVGETKTKILRSLYTFADREDPEILLNLARIVFALRMENSLSAACKMVFKVARSDSNDHLFLEIEDILELFLDGIGLASPLDAAESCIYGYGAIKFLTMNQRILSKLINVGVLDLLVLHLKLINSAKLEGRNIEEQTLHALFQLTGALRNIAATEGALPLFITTNSIPELCKILHHFRQSEDLVTNISRTLSLLSADEDATNVLMSVENILRTIVDLIEQYKTDDKILIRLSYCLGNIVAYSDLARVQLSRSEGSVSTLLKVLQLYVDKDLGFQIEEMKYDENGVAADVVDDIIVKIIRIIANMCMNPVVGSNLSPAEGNDKNSLKLSQLLTILLQRKDPGITLIACLGCLNNISYYCNSHSSLIDITEGIVRVLGLPDEECQAEAARVLGNLTRHKEIRDLIGHTDGMKRLFALLDSKDKEVYRSACGALVNLLLDSETRRIFIESRGIDKLVQGLETFSGDWSFSGLICRALWNSCADDMKSWISHNNVKKLLTTLANSLDEENWNDGDASWEEFALLATDILEKINAHLEVL